MHIWIRREEVSPRKCYRFSGIPGAKMLDHILEDKDRQFGPAYMALPMICRPLPSNCFPSDAFKMRDA